MRVIFGGDEPSKILAHLIAPRVYSGKDGNNLLMVLAPGPPPESCATRRVGGCDARKDGKGRSYGRKRFVREPALGCTLVP